ncbi:MAG: hypothetical protein HYY17_09835 [Planctomycetes bacterium]|nr:hypothetical protein [Planctomycetota bacterium]
MSAWRGPVLRVPADILKRDPAAVWLGDDDAARAFLACPLCGRLFRTTGHLVRSLKMHFAACRPWHRVCRRWEAERLEKAIHKGRDSYRAGYRAGLDIRRKKIATSDRSAEET